MTYQERVKFAYDKQVEVEAMLHALYHEPHDVTLHDELTIARSYAEQASMHLLKLVRKCDAQVSR